MLSVIRKHAQAVLNIIFFAALITLSVLYFMFQKSKVGYVDAGIVMSETRIGAKAQEELQIKVDEYQQEINKREQEIEVLRALLEKDQKQKAVKKELEAKEQSLEVYVQELSKKMPEINSGIMQPVFATINKAIDEFGKEHGYRLILGATPSGNVVYGAPGADLTTELLEYINSKAEIEGR